MGLFGSNLLCVAGIVCLMRLIPDCQVSWDSHDAEICQREQVDCLSRIFLIGGRLQAPRKDRYKAGIVDPLSLVEIPAALNPAHMCSHAEVVALGNLEKGHVHAAVRGTATSGWSDMLSRSLQKRRTFFCRHRDRKKDGHPLEKAKGWSHFDSRDTHWGEGPMGDVWNCPQALAHARHIPRHRRRPSHPHHN